MAYVIVLSVAAQRATRLMLAFKAGLGCAVLCCAVLCCAVLCCAVLAAANVRHGSQRADLARPETTVAAHEVVATASQVKYASTHQEACCRSLTA